MFDGSKPSTDHSIFLFPMILLALGQDPAQSSSIVLTTMTDVVGFFSFLGLATLLAGMLPP